MVCACIMYPLHALLHGPCPLQVAEVTHPHISNTIRTLNSIHTAQGGEAATPQKAPVQTLTMPPHPPPAIVPSAVACLAPLSYPPYP